ncbi:MAG: FHA domain-containing protein [Planctomycetes bacterium]|nr:FHA domain-containing protein [Planctomycetota bacterium]
MIRITVVEGAEPGTHEFAQDVVTIGRSSENAFCIRETSLSRVHCEIAAVQGRFILVNHAKTNGTLVNGKPVGEAVLKAGDELLCGRVRMRFEGGEAPAPAAEDESGARRKLHRRRR